MSTTTTIGAAATASGVKAWQKTIQETFDQTQATATDIGWVRNNDSRLNVVSSLTSLDKVQYFKFNSVSTGQFGFTTQSSAAVRVQIYDPHNRLVADSQANQGVASTNYQNMLHSIYNIQTGNYVIKVTRAPTTDPNAVVQYAMQMKTGSTYANDYVTTQAPLTQDQIASALENPTSQTDPTTSIITSALSGQTGLLGGTDMSGGAKGLFGILSITA